MPVTEFKIKYDSVSIEKDAAVVIVVAAGSSNRMNGVNKQLAEVCGMPVIARTLSCFENSPYISRIILVVRPQDVLDMQNVCSRYMFDKVSDIVEGGSNRHESVMNGFKMLAEGEDTVLIHDGARPFVEERMIRDTVLALKEFDCVTCTVKIVDTVKSVNDDNTVRATVDRTGLYISQTPQGVRKGKYLTALSSVNSPESMTDDAAIMESAGKTVRA